MKPIPKRVRRRLVDASRTAGASRLARHLVRTVGWLDHNAPPSLTILTYHRVAAVDAEPTLAPTMLSATPEEFDDQLAMVSELTTPVTIGQVRQWVDHGVALPPRPLLVTFDDAYRGFAEVAWPRLRDRRIPAVMFVATAYPDHPELSFWWDEVWLAISTGDEHRVRAVLADAGVRDVPVGDAVVALKATRDRLWQMSPSDAESTVRRLAEECGGQPSRGAVMGWDSLQQLACEGLAVGAHTHTHPLLTKLGTPAAQREIRQSIDLIAEHGFDDADVLAYPGGDHDDRIRAVASASGCAMAMTTTRGVNRLRDADPLRLRRINVGRTTSPAVLAAELAGSLARSDRWAGP
ncbi:MAG: polysaccharide deacetylase family protein [Acidimicrobiales bacterium]